MTGQEQSKSAFVARSVFGALAGLLLIASAPAFSQELEPRAYRTLPINLNFVVLSYSSSSGNVLIDPTLPIDGLSAEIQTGVAGYLRSFGLKGRSASFTVLAPYVHMSAAGTVDGEVVEGSRTDWADAQARFVVNLLGGPAMTRTEFARFQQGRTLGVGLSVTMPTGQYDSSKLINFGANRWAFKPEIGYTSVKGPWILELALGGWLFTTNSDGFEGTTKRQDPIGSVQGHISYNFRGGVWLAVDANYFTGGRTTVDGEAKEDLQKNSRVGMTLSIPLTRSQSVKLSAQTGAFTRVGADFDVGTISYQYGWGR